jgi:hypothetical protein
VGGDAGFGDFVKSLERDFGLHRTHIPLFWLAKGVVRIASPAGVSRLDMAIFEDQDLGALSAAPDLRDRLQAMLGAAWIPFVEVDSPRNGERTFI